MIDQWFKKDLQQIHDIHPVAVFIDESGDAEFLLKCIKDNLIIHRTGSDLEELHVKYLIEKARPTHEKILIYTRTPKEDLKFIREYCEINGCLEIRYLQNYIKDKIHQTLNLNINLSHEDLMAAARVSVGKDRTYWMDLSYKGAGEIFDLKRELPAFLHQPETCITEKYDHRLVETFCRKVNALIGREYIKKPLTTLAQEVVKAMLDGLARDNCHKTLLSVYKQWLDSLSHRQSFYDYLKDYTLPTDLDIWKINVDHPFRQVDERWLTHIGKAVSQNEDVSEKMALLVRRHQSPQAKALGIDFWGAVISLLAFDSKNMAYLNSLDECIDFYQKHFYQLDSAIRHLYAVFLNQSTLLAPFQERYKGYLSIFLDKWFSFFADYQETQTGILQRILDENTGIKQAVIVGDGVAYEIAEAVAAGVNGNFQLQRHVILADLPSETENNMSRIYMDNGLTEAVQSRRERYLTAHNPEISMDFIRLDEVTEAALPGEVLICTYKDIDDMGEKLQQKALKYFPETIEFFAGKITLLLNSGYSKVHLITDHGFVLTGLLQESDKITILPEGDCHKAERYLRTVSRQTDNVADLVELEKGYNTFRYLYLSKTIAPFKTPGLYGFAHGGGAPQEVITPHFCWERNDGEASTLCVHIKNKADLKDVTGELFTIILQAEKGTNDLFTMERKVFLLFFADKKQINKSDVFTLQRNERMAKEYTFDGHGEIEVQLLDVATKQQLDRAVIRQNQDRDLGGLI